MEKNELSCKPENIIITLKNEVLRGCFAVGDNGALNKIDWSYREAISGNIEATTVDTSQEVKTVRCSEQAKAVS